MGKQGPCNHCGVATTPLWRNGPPEKPVLCNACGSRWRTRGSLENYMPLHAGGMGLTNTSTNKLKAKKPQQAPGSRASTAGGPASTRPGGGASSSVPGGTGGRKKVPLAREVHLASSSEGSDLEEMEEGEYHEQQHEELPGHQPPGGWGGSRGVLAPGGFRVVGRLGGDWELSEESEETSREEELDEEEDGEHKQVGESQELVLKGEQEQHQHHGSAGPVSYGDVFKKPPPTMPRRRVHPGAHHHHPYSSVAGSGSGLGSSSLAAAAAVSRGPHHKTFSRMRSQSETDLWRLDKACATGIRREVTVHGLLGTEEEDKDEELRGLAGLGGGRKRRDEVEEDEYDVVGGRRRVGGGGGGMRKVPSAGCLGTGGGGRKGTKFLGHPRKQGRMERGADWRGVGGGGGGGSRITMPVFTRGTSMSRQALLSSPRSPLAKSHLPDIFTLSVFTQHLQPQEQAELLKLLPSVDTQHGLASLETLFSSPLFLGALDNFQLLLATGMFDTSAESGLPIKALQLYQELRLPSSLNLQATGWMEKCGQMKKSGPLLLPRPHAPDPGRQPTAKETHGVPAPAPDVGVQLIDRGTMEHSCFGFTDDESDDSIHKEYSDPLGLSAVLLGNNDMGFLSTKSGLSSDKGVASGSLIVTSSVSSYADPLGESLLWNSSACGGGNRGVILPNGAAIYPSNAL